jgi:hypothetical protein
MKNVKEKAPIFVEALRLASLDLAREMGYANETSPGADLPPEIIPLRLHIFFKIQRRLTDQ